MSSKENFVRSFLTRATRAGAKHRGLRSYSSQRIESNICNDFTCPLVGLFYSHKTLKHRTRSKMRVPGRGSPWGRCPRRNHVCYASRWNPVSLCPPWRWHPFPFSSNRRASITRNPFRLGSWWPRESSWEAGPHWSRPKAFVNRCRGHWPRHSQLLKSWRGSLLRSWKGSLRDMRYRGWCRSLSRETTDYRVLLAWPLHEERFTWDSRHSREMSCVHHGYWGYVSKRSFTR